MNCWDLIQVYVSIASIVYHFMNNSGQMTRKVWGSQTERNRNKKSGGGGGGRLDKVVSKDVLERMRC